MSEVDKLTEKAVNEGGILALLYFDIHGSDKENLIQLATGFVQKLLGEEGVIFAKGEIDEPMEAEGLFSTSVEVKVLARDVESMAQLCASYCPFSLEVLEPQQFKIPVAHMQDLLMFVASNSHDYKKYILEKVSPREQQEAYKRNLKNRAEIGKRLLERKKG
jgi:hypothetical protein